MTIPSPTSHPDFSKFWTMFYRHGVNSTLQKNFFFDGNEKEARERAIQHCGIMGYKFYWLRPMICDIVREEKHQLGEKVEELSNVKA